MRSVIRGRGGVGGGATMAGNLPGLTGVNIVMLMDWKDPLLLVDTTSASKAVVL